MSQRGSASLALYVSRSRGVTKRTTSDTRLPPEPWARADHAVAYSESRNAVETDFVPGWSLEPKAPWARFQGPIDSEYDEPCELVLPPWSAIAYHAFSRDVGAALYAALGDTPVNYLAARLGHKRE